MMILGALGVVMVGVGAFSFMGGGGAPEPAPVTTKKKEPAAQNTSETTTQPTTTTAPNGENAGANPSGNPVAVTPTDPGKPTGEETPGNGNPVASAEGTANASSNVVNTLVDPALVAASALPVRDPFNGSRWDPMEAVQPTSNPVSTPTPRPTPKPKVSISKGGRRWTGGGGYTPFPVGDPGSLNGNANSGLPGVGTNPSGMPDIQEVPYKVNGIVSGRNSAAIVTDGSGKQRIVRVGSDLDPDTKVLGVENGQMIVRHRGKVKKISIADSAKSTPAGGGQSQQNK